MRDTIGMLCLYIMPMLFGGDLLIYTTACDCN
jgi:hypothetical protein